MYSTNIKCNYISNFFAKYWQFLEIDITTNARIDLPRGTGSGNFFGAGILLLPRVGSSLSWSFSSYSLLKVAWIKTSSPNAEALNQLN